MASAWASLPGTTINRLVASMATQDADHERRNVGNKQPTNSAPPHQQPLIIDEILIGIICSRLSAANELECKLPTLDHELVMSLISLFFISFTLFILIYLFIYLLFIYLIH